MRFFLFLKCKKKNNHSCFSRNVFFANSNYNKYFEFYNQNISYVKTKFHMILLAKFASIYLYEEKK